jgi:CAAX prenyl protease-like protein
MPRRDAAGANGIAPLHGSARGSRDLMSMDQPPSDPSPPSSASWLDRAVARAPELPYIAPFFAFLILMFIGGRFGPEWFPWSYTLRTFGALAVALAVWKYWPPLGRAHLPEAIVFGLAVAAMWVLVHKWFAGQSWYPATQLMGKDPTPDEFYDPFERLGTGVGLWLFLLVRIGGASIVVPIIEEIFWRGFVLRIFINWHRFETVPLGTFTWRSFIFCSLLSAAEHPMWEVGILCWVVYNLLFYWKKSLLFLMITHGITNLALYVYVVVAKDWVFW